MSGAFRRLSPAFLAPVLLASLVTLAGLPSESIAQELDAVGGDVAHLMRIEARRLEDGRTEFALRLRDAADGWGDRLLPGSRFLPARAAAEVWLASRSITLRLATGDLGEQVAEIQVRVVARPLPDGRIEFGVQHRMPGVRWGERILPDRRLFPVAPRVGRWLVSSPVSVRPPRAEVFGAGGGARSGETLIAVAYNRGCAVRADGGVWCWGEEAEREQLSASLLSDVLTVSVGDASGGRFHTCVLHRDGTVSCWGAGNAGQLGNGLATDQYLPQRVPGISDAVAIASGASHTCAVHADGGVSCWGDGSRGQLGQGRARSHSLPTRVPGLEDVATVSAGPHATCAVHVDGDLSCWGLGATPASQFLSPAKIPGLGDVNSVAIGWSHTCAVRSDGRVVCWPFSTTLHPETIDGLGDAIAVSVGHDSFCALHADGGVSCWGENNASGQLGDGTTRPRPEPRRVAGIAGAVAVAVSSPSLTGEGHACVMHADAGVSCWGTNRYGQLGDGTRRTSLEPVSAVSPPEVGRVAAPRDPDAFFLAWADSVVAAREAELPWLRAAWDHARARTTLEPTLDIGGFTTYTCYGPASDRRCEVEELVVTSMNVGLIAHELAHVYDQIPELASGPAWGAVQLYFAATYPDCYTARGWFAGTELLADTLAHLAAPAAWLTYHHPPVDVPGAPFDSADCPGITPEPSDEAEAVVRAGLAGRIPDWYHENIRDGFDLWRALRPVLSERVLLNLADEFGGFCRTDWITFPLDRANLPPARSNPFRDGGCRTLGSGR